MIPEKAIELYREFAAVLWQEFLQKRVIQAAPLPTGWFSQLKGFRKEIFQGTALLQEITRAFGTSTRSGNEGLGNSTKSFNTWIS